MTQYLSDFFPEVKLPRFDRKCAKKPQNTQTISYFYKCKTLKWQDNNIIYKNVTFLVVTFSFSKIHFQESTKYTNYVTSAYYTTCIHTLKNVLDTKASILDRNVTFWNDLNKYSFKQIDNTENWCGCCCVCL